MQSETQNVEAQPTNPQGIIECPNCHSTLPQGMLFCRMCGTRLTEGGDWRESATAHLPQPGGYAAPSAAQWQVKRRSGPHWIVWVVLGIVVMSFAGGALFRPTSRLTSTSSSSSSPPAQQSRIGIGDSNSVENNGGAIIESVRPPNSPADKAGLIGGDIVTSFDNKQVKDEDDLTKAIRSTPVGKTVEVVYIRDGETKKTNLTTVNQDAIDDLNEIFEESERGQLGVDDLERVPVPNSNIYGVRIGRVQENTPAYLAEMKEGDIITEFNGTQIRTPGELGMRIDRTKPLSTAKIIIVRDGQKMEFNVKIGKD